MNSFVNDQAKSLIAEFNSATDFTTRVDALCRLELLPIDHHMLQELPRDNNNLFIRKFLKKLHYVADTSGSTYAALTVSNSLAPTISFESELKGDLELSAAVPAVRLEHNEKVSVGVFDDLSSIERRLILDALKKGNENIDGYTIRAVKPGFSGAKVYAVFPFVSDERQPYPWIAKVGDTVKLRQEFQNSNSATFRTNNAQCYWTEAGDRACLLQKLASTSPNWPEPLHQKVWPGLRDLDQLCDVGTLRSIIDRFASQYKLFSQCKSINAPLTELFNPILSNIRPQRIIDRLGIYGLSSAASQFELEGTFDTPIHNPLYFYNRLTRSEPQVLVSSYTRNLHGDLHCDNLQIDEYGLPCMIDWGNSGVGHFLIDAAILETSILMKSVPIGLMPNSIHELLTSISHPSILCRDAASPAERARYCVQLLRQNLVDISPSREEFDYDLCLFFVAVQQLQYEDMNIWIALLQAHISIENLKRSLPAAV